MRADLATHQFHELLGDRETQAGAAVLARGGRVRLGELGEQTRQLFGGDADARVFDFHAQHAVGVARREW